MTGMEQPIRPQVFTENIPNSLEGLRQWVTWCYKLKGGRWTKVPFDVRGQYNARVNDPSSWGTYIDAVSSYNAGLSDGIGFVFRQGGEIVGVDIDSCLDEQGVLTPGAKDIVERFRSYTEITPSGRGLHILAQGYLDRGYRHRAIAEIYPASRFFTVTGNVLPGFRNSMIRNAQDSINWLVERIRSEKNKKTQQKEIYAKPCYTYRADDDDTIILRALNAKNGRKFKRFFIDGEIDGYPSHSEADLALLSMLMFWTSGVEPRAARLFRRSALYRPKTDRPDYLIRCFACLRRKEG
jgi:primase-polymerase (primpol)-like protein